MSWTLQGYISGRPETDYGNGDELLEIDRRNEHVPQGITGLSVHYGCSQARFFRGVFEGPADQARAALARIKKLTVYASKYGGICVLADHLPHFVFLEGRDGRTYFFDAEHREGEWRQAVEHILPPELHAAIPPNLEAAVPDRPTA